MIEATGGKCWKNSTYFTQTLLPDYLQENPVETADWDIVVDARGHLLEPHTRLSIGLGTLAVRGYIGTWDRRADDLELHISERFPTYGPANRYKYVLFVEKEGFLPILQAAQIAERYDIAIHGRCPDCAKKR